MKFSGADEFELHVHKCFQKIFETFDASGHHREAGG